MASQENVMRIWRNLTPAQRDYDRFVARSIPAGATWAAETEEGRLIQEGRFRLMDEAEDAGSCSCHISAPCGYCTREIEDEAA